METLFSNKELLSLWLVVFIMGMSKGGFPVAGIALPLLVLLWPEQGQAARSAVSFMLPLLCLMDIFGAFFYRARVNWVQIKKLLPGMLAGVLLASLLFVTDQGIGVSDKILKLIIGFLGLAFSCFHLLRFPSLFTYEKLNKLRPPCFGFLAGLTSTIAHAAGPVMQMYLLPLKLKKEDFAGTTIYFFLILNAVKLIPFAYFGRFTTEQLTLNLWMLPVIPAGVFAGYLMVRIIKGSFYMGFIRLSLAITSLILITKALAA